MKAGYIPYQLCPKCNGTGIVSRPPHIAGDVTEWASSSVSHQCNLCNGQMVIPMCLIENVEIKES